MKIKVTDITPHGVYQKTTVENVETIIFTRYKETDKYKLTLLDKNDSIIFESLCIGYEIIKEKEFKVTMCSQNNTVLHNTFCFHFTDINKTLSEKHVFIEKIRDFLKTSKVGDDMNINIKA